ncbi:hypothetical protein [Macrococcoides bohemicum]|uniref:hypothetical protein n=1 Tax=Macrococcoides bohemicum TaxID=1903056 RepID=UPI00165DAA65|nr:hypothetical protein [Macrococcus bohemicus]MBC9873861.1 hypothetical protein [Macrococcus bohemicus]
MPEPKIPKGYTILPRIILEQEIWKMSPLHFKVYTYLVNKASHVTNDKYERGVCLVTISELQDTCSYNVGYRKERPTKHQIDNVLRWLRKTYEATDGNGTKAPMITSTKTTRGMLVKVHDYSFYQDSKNYENDSVYVNENDTKTTAKTTNTGHYIQEHKELKQELKDYMSDSKSNDRHIESEFNEWYELYNKKKDRKAAFTKFKTARKKHEFDVIMNGTTEYLKTITDKQFQKYPKTFLHNESFLDDYSDVVTTDNTEMQYYDELLGDG